MGSKKYDPLWGLVGEKVALQGQEPDIDAHCPHCNVNLHLGSAVEAGASIACGLCGGVSVVASKGGVVTLWAGSEEQAE